jgi:hypothetical protein
MTDTLQSLVDEIMLFNTGDGQEIAYISLSEACFQKLNDDTQRSTMSTLRDYRTIAGVPWVVSKRQEKAVVFEFKETP